MNDAVFRYILNHLSILNDSDLEEIDFMAGLSVLGTINVSQDELDRIKKLFSVIQKELSLSHYGIKGMKWGIRRYQNKDGSLTSAGRKRLADEAAKKSIFGTESEFTIKTKSGETLNVEPKKPLSAAKKVLNALIGASDDLGRRGDANYDIKNSKGETIGELSLISKNSSTAYLDWITIDESQRGNGYATDVINTLIDSARDSGYQKLELNALKKPRPLYERIGFTYTDTSKMNIMDRINSFEFGCKHMEYDLTKNEKFSDILAHRGVRYTKWNVRKNTIYSSNHQKRRILFNSYIENQIERLNLEKKIKDLTEEDLKTGRKLVLNLLEQKTK